MEDILKKIVVEEFPVTQYYPVETHKDFFVIHHTVSPGNTAKGDINWWLQDTRQVATHCIITQDGIIHQCFKSQYWAHHIGSETKHFETFHLPNINTDLNRRSYSIEFDSLGPVDANGISLAYKGVKQTAGGIVEYKNKFRGYQFFEKYTDAQLESARALIKLLADAYEIPLKYNESMWDLSPEALGGKGKGIWTHVSFRPDKSDCHPMPELIQMLKSF